MGSKTEILKQLRNDIMHIEGVKYHTDVKALHNPFPILQQHLPNGILPQATVHEFLIQSQEQLAASISFSAALINTYIPQHKTLVVVQQQSNCIVFPTGLCFYKIKPEHIIFIKTKNDKEHYWAIEEVMRCQGVTAVLAQMKTIDFTFSRRFQLATEQSGVTGFLLNSNNGKSSNNACTSRWNIKAKPSEHHELPGIGNHAWHVQLLKIKNGKPGAWNLQWNNVQLAEIETYKEQKLIHLPEHNIAQYG